MVIRKVDLMHQLYGVGEGCCVDCSNLIVKSNRGRTLKKCIVYGDTHSEATDWAFCWKACGLKNKESAHRNVVRLVRWQNEKEPLDGQITWGDVV